MRQGASLTFTRAGKDSATCDNAPVATIILSRGRVQPVWAGHPWVFAQAIERIEGAPTGGDVVDVVDPEGRHLGRGYYSPSSAIPVRIATRDRADPLDGLSIGKKVERAAALRARCRVILNRRKRPHHVITHGVCHDLAKRLQFLGGSLLGQTLERRANRQTKAHA
jgi:hypothetical protein